MMVFSLVRDIDAAFAVDTLPPDLATVRQRILTVLGVAP